MYYPGHLLRQFVDILDNVTVTNITTNNTTLVAKGIKSSFSVSTAGRFESPNN